MSLKLPTQASALTQRVQEYKNDVQRGLPAQKKIVEGQEILEDLRTDAKKPLRERELSPEDNDNAALYVGFVISNARNTG